MTNDGKRSRWRTRVIVLTAIAIMAGAVWAGGQAQREASNHAAHDVSISQDLLRARLEMETGVRGFLLTGRESFLEPYRFGLSAYRLASKRARVDAHANGDSELLDQQDRNTDEWIALSTEAIEGRRDGADFSATQLMARKVLMDRYRLLSTRYSESSQRRGEQRERDAQQRIVLIIVSLGLCGLVVGYFAVERPAAQARRRRIEQGEFGELLQFAASEREAHELVRRQLERAVSGSAATVLTINNSDSRLQAATDMPESSPLAERLRAATPDTCLAVRRGKEHLRGIGQDPLIECELCGRTGISSVCTPTLVGGEIMGSVLVSCEREQMGQRDVALIESTAALAAPVLGNLRNLAVAETRAVTDSLTGLANSRAATETLKVMAAFASRSTQPLSAVLVDLDHFKKVNDNYGHQIGDEVLAAAAGSLKESIRASDFIARYGGEEFLVLLQGTDKQGATEVAEKMRRGLAYLRVPDFAGRITASFGVATIPDDATEGDSLLRWADKALYAAKDDGRDKVNVYMGTEAERVATKAGNGSAPEVEPTPRT